MIISLDTEATGLDWVHGAMPYLVTTCDQDNKVRFWEWDVDPLTRKPQVPDEEYGDVQQIEELIGAADLIYLQNGKFDAHMLRSIGIELPWEKVRDTLCAGHLLASNHPHNLTDMCVEYLGVDIEHLEAAVKEVTTQCRAIAKRDYPTWKLAKEGQDGMPSVKASNKDDEDKPWKADMWLPRALAMQSPELMSEDWMVACSEYANADSSHTLPLGLEMEQLIRDRGLWAIYLHRLQQIRADYDIECAGITARGDHTDAQVVAYCRHITESEAAMVEIAAEYGHELELAAGAAINDNMRDFFYGAVYEYCSSMTCKYQRRVKHWNGDRESDTGVCPKCLSRKRNPARVPICVEKRDNLALPVLASKKTGNASLDGDSLEQYVATTDGAAQTFIELLVDKRKYDTAVMYMEQYRRYWVPTDVHGYYRVHCSLNPFGTDHLRQSSNGPNMQNTSSKDIVNTKACFGPMPGREFWSMDYESIEARIPAYESGEEKLISIFEHPDEAPHWGNLYYLMASILYPTEFGACCHEKGLFKERYPRLYKQAKFFLLAKQYGAGRAKGDILSKVRGSYDLVDGDLPKLAALQAYYLNFANINGYVQTLPDRGVDPERGYPLLASRTDDGRVLSTTPFNYHISGTACWAKNRAMVRCADQCRQWRSEGFDAWMNMEVHDELLFDFPRGESWETHYGRALVLKRHMEQSGADLVPAMPTPVAVKYHTENWAKGVTVK